MASVNLKKEQIRTGRIIGTNHMDRTKENDTRSHSNKNINPELSSGNFHVGYESFKEAMDNAEKRLKEICKISLRTMQTCRIMFPTNKIELKTHVII